MDNIDQFEYFILTDEAILAVGRETIDKVFGITICGKKGCEIEREVRLQKNAVVKALHSGKIEVIEDIPSWWEDI